MRRLRPILVVAHRWAGLTIAGFVAVAALTGAALSFNQELTWACAPRLWGAAPPRSGAKPLSGPELAARLARPGRISLYIPLAIDGRHAVAMYVSAPAGRPALDYDQVVVDPFTGAEKARLRFGRLRVFPRDLPTFLYGLYYGFIAGPWGQLAFGLAALIWTVDCFVGFALTLPPARRRAGSGAAAPTGRALLARWRPAWTVRRHARGHRLNHDLHQAGGLWLWPILLVFAWSAVLMSLPQVGDPVTRALGGGGAYNPPLLDSPRATPRLTAAAAQARGADLLAREAARGGFRVVSGDRLDYRPEAGAWRYAARTTLDVTTIGGGTEIWFRDADGSFLQWRPPLGGTTTDAVDTWLTALHEAEVLGLPYRVFVSLFGCFVSGLVVTGVLIWMRKRSARLAARRRKPSRRPHPQAPPPKAQELAGG